MITELIERALAPELYDPDPHVQHKAASPNTVEHARHLVREAAQAVEKALAAAGLAIVPVEPTEAMLTQGQASSWLEYYGVDVPAIYRAMLTAAQEDR